LEEYVKEREPGTPLSKNITEWKGGVYANVPSILWHYRR